MSTNMFQVPLALCAGGQPLVSVLEKQDGTVPPLTVSTDGRCVSAQVQHGGAACSTDVELVDVADNGCCRSDRTVSHKVLSGLGMGALLHTMCPPFIVAGPICMA
jgi:hypothetical protein